MAKHQLISSRAGFQPWYLGGKGYFFFLLKMLGFMLCVWACINENTWRICPSLPKVNSEETPPVYPPAVCALIKKAALLPARSTSKGLAARLDNAVPDAGSSYLSMLIYCKHHSLEAINSARIFLCLKCIVCLRERHSNGQTHLKKENCEK